MDDACDPRDDELLWDRISLEHKLAFLESTMGTRVRINLDEDLAAAFKQAAGPRYTLSPTDVLLAQTIRLLRGETNGSGPAPEPDQPIADIGSDPTPSGGTAAG